MPKFRDNRLATIMSFVPTEDSRAVQDGGGSKQYKIMVVDVMAGRR